MMAMPKGDRRDRPAPRVGCLLICLVLAACSPRPAAAPPTPTRGPARDTIVSLTFDDGNADNFAVAVVLQQYGMHATFYIPSGLVGSRGYMSWQQLHALQQGGNEIGGHSLDHVNIGELQPAALRHEVCDDRKNLVAHGFDPVSFAYPFGGYDDAAKQMVRDCGYADARMIGAGSDQAPLSDLYALPAFPYVVEDTQLDKLQRYVAATRKEGGGWVILIFHHVCDGCDYYSVKPDLLHNFIQWLAGEEGQGHIRVATVGEIVMHGGLP
jgi:peptidoglycan/xylan/chitin deacetylase (PgdA/CDA1 family)